MRLVSLLSLVAIALSGQPAIAQTDLSQLTPGDGPPITLEFENINFVDALEAVSAAGDFELQLSPGLDDATVVSGRFPEVDVATVLRSVLEQAGVNYRVVGRTLIVGPPGNSYLNSPLTARHPGPECSKRSIRPC